MVKKEKKEIGGKSGKKNPANPLLDFAEKFRYHKESDSRWAVLQEARVEYFRGKDFVAFLKAHPDLARDLLPEDLPAGTEPSTIVAEAMLRQKIAVRCDRVVKVIRPGKKKLSKWPARLDIHPLQKFSEEDSFYAWTFERRRPMWQTILSFMVPIITVACCLFPVFPHWCKLGVLYFCLTFLSFILGVLLLRYLVYGALWILAGKRFWFFPNILAEEATLTELFRFWPDVSKDDQPPPKWSTRLAVTAFVGVCVYFCVRHAPDEGARARYRKKVTNIIDEVLLWSPAMLGGGQGGFNATAANETVAGVQPTEASSPLNGTSGDGKSPSAEKVSGVASTPESMTEGQTGAHDSNGKDEPEKPRASYPEFPSDIESEILRDEL